MRFWSAAGSLSVSKMFGEKEERKVIFHCTATPDENNPHARWFKLDISEVRDWHVKGRGWSDVGYHFLIKRNGVVQRGRPLSKKGAHTYGHNHNIGVCYVGTKSPTKQQIASMQFLKNELLVTQGINVYGWRCHHEFSDTLCPGFTVEQLWDYLTLDLGGEICQLK